MDSPEAWEEVSAGSPVVEAVDDEVYNSDCKQRQRRFSFNGRYIYVTYPQCTITEKVAFEDAFASLLPEGARYFSGRESRKDGRMHYVVVALAKRVHRQDARAWLKVPGNECDALNISVVGRWQKVDEFLGRTQACCGKDGDTFGERILKRKRRVGVGDLPTKKTKLEAFKESPEVLYRSFKNLEAREAYDEQQDLQERVARELFQSPPWVDRMLSFRMQFGSGRRSTLWRRDAGDRRVCCSPEIRGPGSRLWRTGWLVSMDHFRNSIRNGIWMHIGTTRSVRFFTTCLRGFGIGGQCLAARSGSRFMDALSQRRRSRGECHRYGSAMMTTIPGRGARAIGAILKVILLLLRLGTVYISQQPLCVL
jgi:hypothetical protein